MVYSYNTAQDSDHSEALVYTDIIKKGWIPLLPASRDCYYDLVVDLGDKFVTLQIKKLKKNPRGEPAILPRVVERSNQRVTKNGKVRTERDYAKKGVEWLVGVNVNTEEIYYYALETYRTKGKSFSVKVHTPDEFPVNHNVATNNKPKPKVMAQEMLFEV